MLHRSGDLLVGPGRAGLVIDGCVRGSALGGAGRLPAGPVAGPRPRRLSSDPFTAGPVPAPGRSPSPLVRVLGGPGVPPVRVPAGSGSPLVRVPVGPRPRPRPCRVASAPGRA